MTSPLANPLSGWANDDLLAAEDSRRHFEQQHPAAYPIFYWPDLVTRFQAYDPQANAHRKRSRKWGLRAAGLGFFGLLITALTPVTASADSKTLLLVLGLLAAALAVAAGIIGYSSVRKGHSKWRWMANRFWTERMRQLHFQFIANNLDLAARAMIDPAARQDWDRLRGRTFADFEHRLGRSVDEAIDHMLADLAEEQPWAVPAWLRPRPAVTASPQLDEIFALLQEQRFGVQTRYPRLKLKPGFYSSRSRLNALRATVEVLTVGALGLAFVTGVLLVAHQNADEFAVKLMIAIAGAMSAAVMTLRVLDEGLQLKSEAERYEWYLAAVESLERQFEAADAPGKVAALREMERISYQELRWFTDSFCKSRFVP